MTRSYLDLKETEQVRQAILPHIRLFDDGTCEYLDAKMTDRRLADDGLGLGFPITVSNVKHVRESYFGKRRLPPQKANGIGDLSVLDRLFIIEERLLGVEDRVGRIEMAIEQDLFARMKP